MKHILLVEDDKKLATLVIEYLNKQGLKAEWEHRGDKAIYRILHEKYDLVILDINLPFLDGLQICRLIRRDFLGFIMMLTARESDEDQITGLEFGADDYIKKPIQPKVLLSRINALFRRAEPHRATQKILMFDDLTIDLEKREVSLNNKIIDLKPGEFDLLFLLASNPGVCFSRNNIMCALRGIDYDGTDRTIDLRISYLRTKLDDDMDNPYRIKTVRGKGYVFQPNSWNKS